MRKDLSTVNGTITNKVESLITSMSSMDVSEIKSHFLQILDDENTSVSPDTAKKWKLQLNSKHDKNSVMSMITNLYLAGSDLSTTIKKEKL